MKRAIPWSLRLFVLLAMLFSVSQVVAQPPGGFGGPGGPGGFGGGGVVGLAMREEVQQELQLVDEQKDKVRDIVEGSRDKFREVFSNMAEETRDLSEDERRAKFREKFESVNTEIEKELGKVLLPHQMDRLKQIDLQTRVRYRGAGALTSGDLAKALNLTEEQREKLEKKQAEVQEELQTKIRELQLEAREKVIAVLTPEQQAQLKKMLGDQFDLPDQPFGGFRGRGGPDGGRGRDRGGRPGGDRPPRDGNQPN
jgi:Spy/CpxP family protein refolding chaperone